MVIFFKGHEPSQLLLFKSFQKFLSRVQEFISFWGKPRHFLRDVIHKSQQKYCVICLVTLWKWLHYCCKFKTVPNEMKIDMCNVFYAEKPRLIFVSLKTQLFNNLLNARNFIQLLNFVNKDDFTAKFCIRQKYPSLGQSFAFFS